MASKDFYSANELLHLALKLNSENEYNELDSSMILDWKIRRFDECVSDDEEVYERQNYVEVELSDTDEEAKDEEDGTK